MIGGLEFAVAMLIAPLVTRVAARLGTHLTMFIGVVVHACGFIAASFAKSIAHLYVTQGLMIGIGIGFLFVRRISPLISLVDVTDEEQDPIRCHSAAMVQQEKDLCPRLLECRFRCGRYHLQSWNKCHDRWVTIMPLHYLTID